MEIRQAKSKGKLLPFKIGDNGKLYEAEGLYRYFNKENRCYVQNVRSEENGLDRNFPLIPILAETFLNIEVNLENTEIKFKDGNPLNISIYNMEYVPKIAKGNNHKSRRYHPYTRQQIETLFNILSKPSGTVEVALRLSNLKESDISKITLNRLFAPLRAGYNMQMVKTKLKAEGILK